jgi:hypothetical protein
MRRYDCNLREWEHTSAYHLIPTGQWLKDLLETECSLEFLDKYHVWFSAKDTTLKDSYILVNFISQGKYPDGTIYNHYWDLQNIGYRGHPRWRLSTHDSRDRWISLMLPEGRPLQPMLERCFTLHKWLVDRETLTQIVGPA